MYQLDTIKASVKNIVLQTLQVDGVSIEFDDQTPFFGTEDHPGVIQDSLAILEISSKLAEEFMLLPSDFNEDAFQNVQTLSEHIFEKVQENAVSVI